MESEKAKGPKTITKKGRKQVNRDILFLLLIYVRDYIIINFLQTPYISNKCIALTSSQEEVNHKLQLILPAEEKEDLNELVNEIGDLPRQVSIFYNLNLELYIHQYLIWIQTHFKIQVTNNIILADFTLHQEHEIFSIFDSKKYVAINSLFPTRVFQDILISSKTLD